MFEQIGLGGDPIERRGKPQAQPDFLTGINRNACVPADHPLRALKTRVDAVRKQRSPLFDVLYASRSDPHQAQSVQTKLELFNSLLV